MEISSLQNLGSLSSGAGVETTEKKKEMGKEDFLTMLVAQLQNQDPLNPMDGTDFTAQLAQFSGLEQMMAVNKNLNGLQMIQTSQNNSLLTNLIGKRVEAEGNGTAIKEGVASDMTFNLEGTAQAVDISIRNSNGMVVRTISEVGVASGEHTISWEGTTTNGEPLPDGLYSFTVAALDSQGREVKSQELIKGEITDISFEEDGSTRVWMGVMEIPLNRIVKIGSINN